MPSFWELIDLARGASPTPESPSATPDALNLVLDPLPDADIIAFAKEFREKHDSLYKWNIWGAGYVIAGGMADDGFHYFRSWIIGKGKECFDVALASPDDLGPFVGDAEVENEDLEYVPFDILESRSEDFDSDALFEESDEDEEADPAGEEFDEDEVYELYPKLATQFSA